MRTFSIWANATIGVVDIAGALFCGWGAWAFVAGCGCLVIACLLRDLREYERQVCKEKFTPDLRYYSGK